MSKEGNMCTWYFRIANSWPNMYLHKFTLSRSLSTIGYLAFFFVQWHNQAKSSTWIASSNRKAGAFCEQLWPSQWAGAAHVLLFHVWYMHRYILFSVVAKPTNIGVYTTINTNTLNTFYNSHFHK
jgi:hypothetical protein